MMTAAIQMQNIAENDGIAISVTGMTIVFFGLLVVSLFIAGLPKLLDHLDRLKRAEAEGGAGAPDADDPDERVDEEVAAAIALVLELALTPEDGSAMQRITIRRTESDSLWKHAGRLNRLSKQVPMKNFRQ